MKNTKRNGKKVHVYNLEGNWIAEYASQTDAAKKLSKERNADIRNDKISSCVKGKNYIHEGLRFSNKKYKNGLKPLDKDILTRYFRDKASKAKQKPEHKIEVEKQEPPIKLTESPKHFSYFQGKGVREVKPKKSIDLKELIRLFKSDVEIKRVVDAVRSETDKEKQKQLKMQLPFITTSGLFTYRKNTGIIENTYTWLCPIDIDEKDNENFDDLLEKLKQDEIVIFAAISPRGKGIKALVQLVKDSYDYKDQYNVFRDNVYPQLDQRWHCKLDRAQGKLSQPFFITHDPNLHINVNYKIFNADLKVVTLDAIMSGNVSGDAKDIAPFVTSIVNQVNNKWDFFNRVAIFVGGLISGNQINMSKEKALASLIDASKKNVHVENYTVAEKQIIDGFEYGFSLPIDSKKIRAKQNIRSIINQLSISDDTRLPYVRVGNDYYKKTHRITAAKRKLPYFLTLKRQTLTDDHGTDFLKQIKKYDGFCNVPDNLKHQYTHDNNYNLFKPFTFLPKDGEWQTIEQLFLHVFGNQYEMGLDYMQLLLTRPLQILPVLCIVSKANHTGKTTFAEFMETFFKGNVAIIETSDFNGAFNQHWISKFIIIIDESDLNKETSTSKIKQYSTQKYTHRKGKYQDEAQIDFIGKFIILSNNERSFINIKDDDIRYWIRKVDKIEKFNAAFQSQLESEIPAFLQFLLTRKMETEKMQSRAWFSTKQLETKWLLAAKDQNRTGLAQDLKERLLDWFGKNPSIKTLICRPMDLKDKFYPNHPQFSIGYISTSLKDDFNLVPNTVAKRLEQNLTLANEGKLPGFYFSLTLKDLIKYDIQSSDSDGIQDFTEQMPEF